MFTSRIAYLTSIVASHKKWCQNFFHSYLFHVWCLWFMYNIVCLYKKIVCHIYQMSCCKFMIMSSILFSRHLVTKILYPIVCRILLQFWTFYIATEYNRPCSICFMKFIYYCFLFLRIRDFSNHQFFPLMVAQNYQLFLL